MAGKPLCAGVVQGSCRRVVQGFYAGRSQGGPTLCSPCIRSEARGCVRLSAQGAPWAPAQTPARLRACRPLTPAQKKLLRRSKDLERSSMLQTPAQSACAALHGLHGLHGQVA